MLYQDYVVLNCALYYNWSSPHYYVNMSIYIDFVTSVM